MVIHILIVVRKYMNYRNPYITFFSLNALTSPYVLIKCVQTERKTKYNLSMIQRSEIRVMLDSGVP